LNRNSKRIPRSLPRGSSIDYLRKNAKYQTSTQETTEKGLNLTSTLIFFMIPTFLTSDQQEYNMRSGVLKSVPESRKAKNLPLRRKTHP
jgi:hypothetical protein